jgi:putative glutamine amidotransferase
VNFEGRTNNATRPVIGIGVCLDAGRIHRPGRDYLYLASSYVEAVEEAGGTPILLPISPDLAALELIDGLVLPGGVDLHPSLYGEVVRAPITLEEERRVDFDRRLLDAMLTRGRPILAVCYGMQLLNVHLGGTLLQELDTDPIDHGSPGDERVHQVRIEPGSLLAAVYSSNLEVSQPSSHRQAVAEVGSGLSVTALAPDGVIEAIEHPGAVIGVQWHPESTEQGRELYRFIVDRAGDR